MNKECNIMLDLETLGVDAGCGILAIGACTFDTQEQFYTKILPDDNHNYGLVQNPDTMAWWQKQSVEARNESFSGTQPLVIALGAFSDWLRVMKQKYNGDDPKLWGNGADFDLPILKACYNATNMRYPIRPYNGRCYRTLKNMYPYIKAEPFEGIKHTALADSIYQARHAVTLLLVANR